MLKKLLKYEFLGFRFPLAVMLIVMLSTTVMTCGVILTIRPSYGNDMEWYSVMAFILSILVYYFGLIGCSLGTMLAIAIRFYKTCYTDQGYLTHTLPAPSRTILNAKIIAAIAFMFTTCLAMLLSLLIIGNVGLNHTIALAAEGRPSDFASIAEARRVIFDEIFAALGMFERKLGISFGAYVAYIVIYSAILAVANIIIILGCVSLGQLYAKHRIIGAVGAYFIVQFVLQTACSFATVPMYIKIADNSNAIFGSLSPSMNIMLFLTVATAAGMYFVNLNMMTRRLNLE